MKKVGEKAKSLGITTLLAEALFRCSKLFRLDRTVPFSFRPKYPEILVEWKAPHVTLKTVAGRAFALPTVCKFALGADL